MLQSIVYDKDKTSLQILDQLLLPHTTKFIDINSVEDAYQAIKTMQVRGAPAIAIVGCLGIVVDVNHKQFSDITSLQSYVVERLDYLVSARPTAVNMKRAAEDIKTSFVEWKETHLDSVKTSLIKLIENMLEKDISDNKAIGKYGAKSLIDLNSGVDKLNILTHCNTGSLATAGYGTALGVIRSLHSLDKIGTAFCTETRPYNQGARLTAYELVYENIPAKLICDSAVAVLLKTNSIHGIVVGADRVAANGDTANKIGTYQIAVAAKHHNVPFFVAAPWTSIDLNIPNGDAIVIEQRPSGEMTHVAGIHVAASGIECWNPAFDVTPAELISGIITETGTFQPDQLTTHKLKS
uniref:Methylthioribose-1-phosphate isomerase n=2 Tax=Cacopsylla melanoneura TaxID=428564 RepID=A0A8D8LVE2_9HEMI